MPAPASPRRSLAAVLTLLLTAAPALPQTPLPPEVGAADASTTAAAAAKRPLTIADFDGWRSIHAERLSPDGRWLVYTLVPQVGEGEVVVRSTDGATEYRHTRGYVGRPNTRPGASRGEAYSPSPAVITADGRYALFTIEPTRAEYDAAQRSRRGPRAGGARGRTPSGATASLGIMSTADGAVTTIERVKSFEVPEESGRWVAYLLEADTASAPADSAAPEETPAAAATPGGEPRPVADSVKSEKEKTYGTTLVLRELATGAETRIEDVVAYGFDDEGRWLSYTTSSKAKETDGAYVRDLERGETRALLTGEGDYEALTFDDDGAQVAFVSNRDDYAAESPRWTLYHARADRAGATPLIGRAELGDDLVLSDRMLEFTKNGKVLHFGVRPPPLDSIPADSLADKAVFDLWHWKDARLQPQQRVEANRDRERAHLAVYHLDRKSWTRVGDETLERVSLSEDGRLALGTTGLPYAVQAMWGEDATDVYLIDAVSGQRTLVADSLPQARGADLSPDGRYVIWFDQNRWWAYDVAAKQTRDLTGSIEGVRFEQETWDTPSLPAPWGVAGWTRGDRSVLIYDRFDIWELDPAGRRPARMVTDSLGVGERMQLRLVDLDREEERIDPDRPMLLRALDEDTKQSGFWRDRLGSDASPERIVMDDVRFGFPDKAEDADLLLWTRSTVSEFPDLWVSDTSFRGARKLTQANPQQADFLWPSVELVEWRSADGVLLKGLLFKPEGFDPSKKYPMAVYFYEQLSDNLHAYNMSTPRNLIHPTLYASQGYLVFEPDIHYDDGYPGPSALKSIVPGVHSLIARGFVDPEAVGIGGQSWGGYQTAWIVTQTNLFAAAMAGAPVANMTSAYGGIRWGTGLNRSFQYEKGQSRIGGSLWEYPWRYIENSPLFAADRIQTPLLMMHNDNDGAVPWYQGIEMFVAMRRLGKEVYLFNYNGDEHNPTKRANQLDIAMRMLQFFDHHLKGAPAPSWMTDGIPYLEKGRDQLTKPKVAEEGAVSAGGGSSQK